MKKVTEKEFYDFINPRDIICDCTNKYPYTTFFKTRRGMLVGKIVDSYPNKDGSGYPLLTNYYLKEVKSGN